MYRQPNTTLQNSIPKLAKTKPQKYLPMSNLSWNSRQDFLKIPCLWEAALETERRCFSKVNLESNVTPNISRSTDSCSTVPSMVNGGGWGCIVRDLETIIVLVLLEFNSIPQRSPHHAFTLTRSRFMDSVTVTRTPGDGTKLSKWSCQHNQLACSAERKQVLRCTEGTTTGPKHCPAAHLTKRWPVYCDIHPPKHTVID